MKILVVGGSGLIGNHLCQEGARRGHQILGTYRHYKLPDLIHCDCWDLSEIKTLLEKVRPEAVIHAAGWTWVDGCENNPARAFLENAEQPAQLAELCDARKIYFIYISSSYVFDGAEGPYRENAEPSPINIYGRSKLEGERKIQVASGGKALIARAVCAYGAEAQKKNFTYQIWRAMETGEILKIPSDQKGNPTYAGDLAHWLLGLVENGAQGIRHLAGPRPDCTRWEWAEMLVNAFEKAGITKHPAFSMKAVPTSQLKQKALRPLHAGLLSDEILPATNFEETIRLMVSRANLLAE